MFELDPSEVSKATTKMRAEFEKAMARYNSLTKKGKEGLTKPAMPTYPQVHYICMCSFNKCRNLKTGEGCINCEVTVAAGMEVPYSYAEAKCMCPVCSCPCNKYFPKSKRKDILVHVRMALLEEKATQKAAAKKQGKFICKLFIRD